MNQGETKHLGKAIFYRKTTTTMQEFDKLPTYTHSGPKQNYKLMENSVTS